IYRFPPAFHSLPPRRSSDLCSIRRLPPKTCAHYGYSCAEHWLPAYGAVEYCRVRSGTAKPETRPRDAEASRARRSVVRRRAGGRSEEHTSELQSRENLVCRL